MLKVILKYRAITHAHAHARARTRTRTRTRTCTHARTHTRRTHTHTRTSVVSVRAAAIGPSPARAACAYASAVAALCLSQSRLIVAVAKAWLMHTRTPTNTTRWLNSPLCHCCCCPTPLLLQPNAQRMSGVAHSLKTSLASAAVTIPSTSGTHVQAGAEIRRSSCSNTSSSHVHVPLCFITSIARACTTSSFGK